MADKHIADGEAAFKAVSSAPDVCIVGIVPVPFDSFQTLVSQKQYASTVWARGCSVLNVGSVIAGSQGNTGSGVASGTSLASGDCIILTGSPTVFVEGKPAARHGSLVGMNNMNCVGSLYTLVEPPLVSVKDNTVPCNNPPVTSAALEKMKARKEDMEHGLLAKARHFLDMGSVLKSGDAYAGGLIGKLRPGKIEGAGTVGEVFNAANETGAGVVRGVLGLGWDLVSGVEHLGNSAVQFSLSQTTEELSLDAAILGENIRLGNVCAEGLLQDAKQTLNAAKKAAADEWDNASHASLGDQAEMATRILGLIGSFFVGAGEAKVAGSVSKVSEAARIDEVNETVKILDEIEGANNGIYVIQKPTVIIEQSKQNKHILGTNEYKISLESGLNKSILTVLPNSLLSEIGSGKQVGNILVGMPGSKERIDFGRVIGNYVERDTGALLPTSNGIVHYSKKGVHVVPSRP
ncbi:DUF4150 domain-containing protein [Rahnella sp. PD12R]|uniref:polymorphic toxin type 50 domain-containing protein n=1 Tax=Rahnella sp. PD12R TaxID=2855688 RepID=UPI001C446E7F|nr:polymorphic toxin type 50 domain-containing protein [Rahnella sp. PD12R]MBV6818401.1 DUF4150 domain-containing protein [Rahnella sp. PD12R]